MEAAYPPISSPPVSNPVSDETGGTRSKTAKHMWAASVFGFAGATVMAWPLDVLKTHTLAGRSTGITHVFSRYGLMFGVGESALLALDISGQYLEHSSHYSTPTKVLLSLAPCSLLPALSCLNLLKINAQVTQESMLDTWYNVTKQYGYKALTRGMVPYSAIALVTLATLVLPQHLGSESVTPYLIGGGFFANMLINTPLDILKTRAMLNMPATTQILTKELLQSSLNIRFCHFLGFMVAQFTVVLYVDYYLTNRKKKQKVRAEMEAMQDKFTQPTEFDGMVPEDTTDLDIDQILDLCETKDG